MWEYKITGSSSLWKCSASGNTCCLTKKITNTRTRITAKPVLYRCQSSLAYFTILKKNLWHFYVHFIVGMHPFSIRQQWIDFTSKYCHSKAALCLLQIFLLFLGNPWILIAGEAVRESIFVSDRHSRWGNVHFDCEQRLKLVI